MQLSGEWIRKIMQGTTGKESVQLPTDLIKLNLAQSAYIPEVEYEKVISGEKRQTYTCPEFMRKAFRDCLSEKQLFRLKELYLICLRYKIGMPGEMMPECFALYAPESLFAIQALQAMKHELQFVGDQFHSYSALGLPDEEKWNSLKPKERKMHLQSRLAWSLSREPFQWITGLPASERTDLLSSFIYLDWNGKKEFAEDMAGSQSTKANAWANAYLLKYPDISLSEIALEYLIKQGVDSLQFQAKDDDEELPFPVACPSVLEDTDNQLLHLLSWSNPEKLFSSSEILEQDFSQQLLDQKNASDIVLALLHASIYHEQWDWVEYLLELVSFGGLYEIWDAKGPSELITRVPQEKILKAFDRDLKNAETDMDRLDAIYHWLYAGDLFLSKEITEQVWPAIANGVDLLSVGGISSGKYKPFFDWIQFRIYPGFPIHWSIQKSGLVHEFQQSVNKRYHFYKSLNAWLKKNQSN